MKWLPLAAALFALLQTGTAFGVLASNRTAPPALNLTTLTDGSLGGMPAKLLLLQGILAQMNATNSISPLPSASKDQKEEDRKPKTIEPGAVVGSTIGSALAAGLVNADKGPATALCKALVAGAGSAVGSTTGKAIGGMYPPPDHSKSDEGKDKRPQPNNTTVSISSSSSASSAKPYQKPDSNDIGPSMVAPGIGSFVGGSVSGWLGKGICDGLFKDWTGKWFSKIADEILPPDMADAGRTAMREALANGKSHILMQILESAGVPVHRASEFVSDIASSIRTMSHSGLDNIAEELQRDLLYGASQVSDMIASGEGAALSPALGALNQLGAAAGITAGIVAPIAGNALSPTQQFQGLTSQLSLLNILASSLAPQNQFFRQAQPSIENLLSAASQAAETGPSRLRDAGKDIQRALGPLAPYPASNEKEKVHHVTKTRVLIATHHATKTHHKTDIVQKFATKTEHAKVTDHVIIDTTKTVTKTITKTNTKEEKATTLVTQTRTQIVQAPAPTVGRLPDRSWIRLSPSLLCRSVENKRHLLCYGTSENPITYRMIGDTKFKKCLKEDDAHCFDNDLPYGIEIQSFASRSGKGRGVACAAIRDAVRCWGTLNHSGIEYEKIEAKKYSECNYDKRKCS